MRSSFHKKAFPCFLGIGVCLMLAGCGAQPLPTTYEVGQDTLPAFGTTEEQFQGKIADTQTDEETGVSNYTYTELVSGVQAVKTYVDVMDTEYGCQVIDQEGVIQETPDFSQAEGEVLIGKNLESEEGIFQLNLQWTENTCEVVVSKGEGQVSQAKVESISMEEAVDMLQKASPQELDLPGESMEDYVICADVGYVMVDGQASFRMNVYDRSTRTISGTYLLTLDGQHLYQLDRKENSIRQLSAS